MKYFKYKIEEDLDEDELNKLGKDGWELINVVYETWENTRKGYQEIQTKYYFKKEL